jgi:hypothetical protein
VGDAGRCDNQPPVFRSSSAQALAAMPADFKFKQPKFDIGKIKMTHFNWKMKPSSVLEMFFVAVF